MNEWEWKIEKQTYTTKHTTNTHRHIYTQRVKDGNRRKKRMSNILEKKSVFEIFKLSFPKNYSQKICYIQLSDSTTKPPHSRSFSKPTRFYVCGFRGDSDDSSHTFEFISIFQLEAFVICGTQPYQTKQPAGHFNSISIFIVCVCMYSIHILI